MVLAGLLAAGGVLPPDAGAQGGALSGVVRDSARGIAIAGAEVRIGGTARWVVTDAQGQFRLADDGARPVTFEVRRLGFRPIAIAMGAGVRDVPALLLVPSVRYLEPVRVRAERTRYTGRLAGYYERLERRTQGLFITRADLEREQPPQLTDMLQRQPGVRVTRGRPGAQSVRMRDRGCRPLVWLDGAPMATSDVDLDSFSPGSLEGIEMYMGASGPARYQAARGQSECGTILLWSRGPDTEPRVLGVGVSPGELESLIASRSVYAADEVEEPVALDSTAWTVPYPPSLRASGISGSVLAEFVVDTLGRVESDNFGIVASSHPLFSAAVREAASGAVFRAAMRGGRKVRQLVRQPFEFRPVVEPR
jgi:TonB family protein